MSNPILEAVKELTADRNREIVEALKSGVTQAEAAEKYGISTQRAHQIARAHKIVNARRKLAQQRASQVVKLAKQGLSVQQIAGRLGISCNTVRSIACDNGVKFRRRMCRQSTVHAVCLMLETKKTLTEIASETDVNTAVLAVLSKRIRELGFRVMCRDGRRKENKKPTARKGQGD